METYSTYLENWIVYSVSLQDTHLKLRTSRGLQMQVKSSDEHLSRDLKVPLSQSEPFQTVSIVLRVLAELPPQKDAGTIEHKASNWVSVIKSRFKP